MRKFGLLGGTSWHSTIDYYRALNQAVNQHYQSNVNPPLYLANLDQHEIHSLQKTGDWEMISEILVKKCQELETIGCTGIPFCTNTPHRVFDQVQNELSVPVIHIGQSIGKHIKELGHQKTGLLGTRYTMEGDFISGVLQSDFEIDVVAPDMPARQKIQALLYDEMSHGLFQSSTRDYFLTVIDELRSDGAEAVILACTEFPLLLKNIDTCIPKIDSTMCHVNDIVDFILR